MLKEAPVHIRADVMDSFFTHCYPSKANVLSKNDLRVYNHVALPVPTFSFSYTEYLQYLREYYVTGEMVVQAVPSLGLTLSLKGLRSQEEVIELLDNENDWELKKLFLGELGILQGLAIAAYGDAYSSFCIGWSGLQNSIEMLFTSKNGCVPKGLLEMADRLSDECFYEFAEQILLLRGVRISPQRADVRMAALLYSNFTNTSRESYPLYDVLVS